jgi:2-deoxy-D-gluconate 3-dehydrogenase
MDTNLTSAFLCARAAHPHMQRARGGKIVNIGSMMSLFGAAFAPAYGASKGGIVQLTKSLAVAWAADNIQVNAVLPGWVDTDLTRHARQVIPDLNERVLRGLRRRRDLSRQRSVELHYRRRHSGRRGLCIIRVTVA